MKPVRLTKMCLYETYSEVHIGKHLSDNFPIQKSLRQGDALSSLFFSFVLEYANRKVQENKVGLKLNGTRQLLVSAVDVNLVGDSINTIKKNTETLIDTGKDFGLKVENYVYVVSSPECRAKS
jgi:hypothetical protein